MKTAEITSVEADIGIDSMGVGPKLCFIANVRIIAHDNNFETTTAFVIPINLSSVKCLEGCNTNENIGKKFTTTLSALDPPVPDPAPPSQADLQALPDPDLLSDS